MKYGLTRKKLRLFVYGYAIANDKIIPDKWMSDKTASVA